MNCTGGRPKTTWMRESMHYFVFDEGMGEVAGAVADDEPDKSGL